MKEVNLPILEFGQGEKLIVILPSLMDSFKSCLDNEKILKRQWRDLAQSHRLMFISRPNKLNLTTSQNIAKMIVPQIPKCDLMIGISMGGLIAQHLINIKPDICKKLVLAMSSDKQNSDEINTLLEWQELSENENWQDLQKSTLEVIYNKPYKPESGLRLIVPKPRSKSLLVNSIKACISHNSSEFIAKIKQKTLIIACEFDRLFPLQELNLLSKKMMNAKLFVILGASHGLHGDSMKQLQKSVDQFLNEG
ncbi:MAG: hypothetical protein COB02_10555 [Candidatus Cloacimonadota bacterium]|nr:MAG: hypothetical protein COB02_10555 [Candidatus Cloacimonadota bacterium]